MWYVVLFLLGAMAGVFVMALANAASCRDCDVRDAKERKEGYVE